MAAGQRDFHVDPQQRLPGCPRPAADRWGPLHLFVLPGREIHRAELIEAGDEGSQRALLAGLQRPGGQRFFQCVESPVVVRPGDRRGRFFALGADLHPQLVVLDPARGGQHRRGALGHVQAEVQHTALGRFPGRVFDVDLDLLGRAAELQMTQAFDTDDRAAGVGRVANGDPIVAHAGAAHGVDLPQFPIARLRGSVGVGRCLRGDLAAVGPFGGSARIAQRGSGVGPGAAARQATQGESDGAEQ